MKRYLSLLILLGTAALLNACKKVNFGDDGGFTERDNTGVSTGHVDKSDWGSDATWKKQELALFKELSLDLNGAQQGAVRDIILYPNPVATQPNLRIGQPGSATKFAWTVVDRKYKVVKKLQESSISYGYAFDFSSLKKGETYRMYYVFYAGAVLVSKGHGDIKMLD